MKEKFWDKVRSEGAQAPVNPIRLVKDKEPENAEGEEQMRKLYETLRQKFKKFSKYTSTLLRGLKPLLRTTKPPPYPLKLNVYNLLNTNVLNGLGVGFFHSAIEICGIEVAFGGHDFDETGVYVIKPRSLHGAQFYRSENIEDCYLSVEDIAETFLEAAIKWKGNVYDMIHFNCNDFTSEMCRKLVGKDIPSYVNRASRIARPFTKSKTTVQGDLANIIAYQHSQKHDGEEEQEDEDAVLKKGRDAMVV